MANETNEQLTDVQKFKKVLGYFVAHLSYLNWRENKIVTELKNDQEYISAEGIYNDDNKTKEEKDAARITMREKRDEYLKNNKFPKPDDETTLMGYSMLKGLIEAGKLNISGQGYKGAAIQNHIKDWDLYSFDGYDNQKICISIQTGLRLYDGCYLHWYDPNKNEGNININPIWDNNHSNISSLEVGIGKNAGYAIEDKPQYSMTDLKLFENGEPNDVITNMLDKFKELRLREITGNFLVGACKYKLEKNKNIVLTGAPGTGKTYLAKEIAANLVVGCSYNALNEDQKKQIGFVQFHPSYDYSDFVEGLRSYDNNEQIGFRRQDGVFKKFCKDALKAYKDNKDNAPKYVFIIDEINRGELSKIFGELFYSIDPGYRGESGKVKTQYQNLVDFEVDNEGNKTKTEDVFKNGFFVPENVYIIGTMNDIDRSVEPMDFAIRRRFVWIDIKPEDRISMWNDESWGEQAKIKMHNINAVTRSVESLGEPYCIGPAYFNNPPLIGDLIDQELWSLRIEPILKEYLRVLPKDEAAGYMETFRLAFNAGKEAKNNEYEKLKQELERINKNDEE